MELAALTGLVASGMGVLMALSPLLQARRVQLAQDSSEVSSGVFLVMRVNASVWLLYGVATSNVFLIVPNVVALATTSFTLLAIRRNRPQPAAAPAALVRDTHMARVRGGAASVARAGRRMAFARR